MRLCYNCGFSVSGEAFINSPLIESGVAFNLIDGALVEELGIPTFPCVPSLRITAIDTNPVILGFPWLRRHDPQISWRTGELARWSPTCLKECLREPVSRPCQTSCIEEATPVVHGHLPQPHADFWEVFSEERAARLPAHQVWDCALAAGHIRLSTSPAALINGVFQDLLGKGVIAYIDNILVYSASMEDHVHQVQEVLARLQRTTCMLNLRSASSTRPR
ncbi:hypothetical protein QTP70_005300 [Hemibagrus guttatus]|uniref:Reverse transcriptase domain-containing protein n=1 Tax=Hemibagrus guttatus TaxID=175788 RepID=A0AAE0Q097_9TELE|nr:hypothetical protein QTP70_005300 [Hemibagrus guttatus]